MSIILRPYQEDIIIQARDLMSRGKKSILIQSPTGSGKTALTAHMIKTAASKGMSSWFMVHRRELIKQSALTFAKVNVDFGIACNGFHFDTKPSTHICSVQSMKSRSTYLKRPSLIIWDETHHIKAGTWERIFKDNPQAFHIGLTATPCRLDGQGLNEFYNEMILGPKVQWLIDNNYLCKYKYFAPIKMDTSQFRTSMGEYNKEDVNSVVTDKAIVGDVVTEYNKYSHGKRAVVFCASIKHSLWVRDQFNQAGIAAEHLDGEYGNEQRDACLNRFTSGQTKVLCNVDLFGEGFDLPSIEAVILLRPTQSLGLYLQQVGRALRPSEGKEYAIILDHVGNYERHGLPNEEREWSLDGISKKKKESVSTLKICPKCFAAIQFWPCSNCGHMEAPKGRGELENIDGELTEVTKRMVSSKRIEQGKAKSFDDLVALGRSRGYKRPELWAKHLINARQAKRNSGHGR